MCPKKLKKTRFRARTWMFTLANPEKELLAQLALKKGFPGMDIIKYLIQPEKSESGLFHLQGAIQFKNTVEFNVVKKLLPKAHWETSRSLKSTFKYCGKLATRQSNPYCYGDVNQYIEKEEETESKFLDNLRYEMTGFLPHQKIPEFY